MPRGTHLIANTLALSLFTFSRYAIAQFNKLALAACDRAGKVALFFDVDVSKARGLGMRWHLRSADLLALTFKAISGAHLHMPANAQPMMMKKNPAPRMLMTSPNLAALAVPRSPPQVRHRSAEAL